MTYGAVGVELVLADREQLRDLAREVQVGNLAGRRVFLRVLPVREVDAHHRVIGHVLEQLAEVAEGVLAEHVVVRGDAAGLVAQGGVGERDHHDLREGEGDALAQLVVAAERLGPPRVPEVGVAELLADRAQVGGGLVDVQPVQRLRLGELLVDPLGIGHAGQAVDLRLGRAHRGLAQEARRLGRVRLLHRDHPAASRRRAGRSGCRRRHRRRKRRRRPGPRRQRHRGRNGRHARRRSRNSEQCSLWGPPTTRRNSLHGAGNAERVPRAGRRFGGRSTRVNAKTWQSAGSPQGVRRGVTAAFCECCKDLRQM